MQAESACALPSASGLASGEAAALEDGLDEVDAEVVAEMDVVGGVEDEEVGLLAEFEAAHEVGLAHGPGGVEGGGGDGLGAGCYLDS